MSGSKKREADFLAQLTLSESSLRNYKFALNSTLLRETLEQECGVSSLYELTDLDTLWRLYCKINLHPKNVAAHRAYSAAVMKYVRFLNHGEKYCVRKERKKKKKGKKRTVKQ